MKLIVTANTEFSKNSSIGDDADSSTSPISVYWSHYAVRACYFGGMETRFFYSIQGKRILGYNQIVQDRHTRKRIAGITVLVIILSYYGVAAGSWPANGRVI